MAETPIGQAGRAPGGASQRVRAWYPLHRCPECGAYTRITPPPDGGLPEAIPAPLGPAFGYPAGGGVIRQPTGEVYLACRDRIECGYQETLE